MLQSLSLCLPPATLRDDLLPFIVEEIADHTGLPVGIKSAVGQMDFWREFAEIAAVQVRPQITDLLAQAGIADAEICICIS